MRRIPELMQFEIGISTIRYLPARGTAGFERSFVSGKSRVPAPPPMMTARVFSVIAGGVTRSESLGWCAAGVGNGPAPRSMNLDGRTALFGPDVLGLPVVLATALDRVGVG